MRLSAEQAVGILNQNARARYISLNVVNEGFWVIGDTGRLFI